MAYNFPASPTEDQLFTPAGGPTYIYKAPRWLVQSSLAIADAPDAQNYVRTLGAWVLGYTKAAIDTLLGTKADTSAMTTADNLRVLKAGDTMTGNLTVSKASPQVILDKPASGTAAALIGKTGGLNRWIVYPGWAEAESGANAGSSFRIERYNDAGALIDTPIIINRIDGVVNMPLGAITLTPPVGDNDTSVATTAFVTRANAANEAFATYATSADLTVVIPFDDTVPQSSEGTQILSVAITPRSTTSKLRATFQGQWTSVTAQGGIAALFSSGFGVNALAAHGQLFTANGVHPVVLSHEWVAGSVAAQTITVRVGPQTNPIRMNGYNSARYLGGSMVASLIVEEVEL